MAAGSNSACTFAVNPQNNLALFKSNSLGTMSSAEGNVSPQSHRDKGKAEKTKNVRVNKERMGAGVGLLLRNLIDWNLCKKKCHAANALCTVLLIVE